MIGTAQNSQTREGMEHAADHWQKHQLHQQVGPLLLAGYSCDRFFQPGQFGPGVKVLGPLDDNRHDNILAKVKACLCYQSGGSGALTRITEMLLAGVPVLANAHAARSHHGRSGLIEFSDLRSIEMALTELTNAPEEILPPPRPDASSVMVALKQLER